MAKKLTEEQHRRLTELRKREEDNRRETDVLMQDIERTAREEERYLNVLHDADKILGEIEENFELRTGLSRTDSVLLFIATAIQLYRIYALPKLKDKFQDSARKENDDPLIKKEEKVKMKGFRDKHMDKDDDKNTAYCSRTDKRRWAFQLRHELLSEN